MTGESGEESEQQKKIFSAPNESESLSSKLTEQSTKSEFRRNTKDRPQSPELKETSAAQQSLALARVANREMGASHTTGSAKSSQSHDTNDGSPAVPAPIYATIWRRGAAVLIDEILLWCLYEGIFACYAIVLHFAMRAVPPNLLESLSQGHIQLIGSSLTLALSLSVFWIYTVAFECSSLRGTPGKRILGMAVLDTSLNRITFWNSSLKYFLQGLTYLVCAAAVVVLTWNLPIDANIRGLLVLPIFFATNFVLFMLAIFNSRRQTPFDVMTRRVVVRQSPSESKFASMPIWQSEAGRFGFEYFGKVEKVTASVALLAGCAYIFSLYSHADVGSTHFLVKQNNEWVTRNNSGMILVPTRDI